MLKVADFVKQLPEAEHVALANHVGAGLHGARLAAQCFTDPTPQSEDVAQLLAYLSCATREFEGARALVVRRST